jgi:hypothetical protein
MVPPPPKDAPAADLMSGSGYDYMKYSHSTVQAYPLRGTPQRRGRAPGASEIKDIVGKMLEIRNSKKI